MQPSSDRHDDVEHGFGRRGQSRQNNRRSNDIELSNIGHQPVQLMAKGRQSAARQGCRNSPKTGRGTDRGGNSKHVYRNPFGSSRRCRYQHRNCVYDHRLRKCREQLTPVTEVSTPDSGARAMSSASISSGRKSRPGTPIAVPGTAHRIPSPDFYSDNEGSCSEEEGNLPGYVPESEKNVTTLKATATVTLELTSSSSSIPYRVTRLHAQNE